MTSSPSSSFTLHHRLRVVGMALPPSMAMPFLLEPTADAVWLSRTVKCFRHTLHGVPGKRLDILVQEGMDWDAESPILEVGDQCGRYDGGYRSRLTFRRPGSIRPDSAREALPGAVFLLSLSAGEVSIQIRGEDTSDVWSADFRSFWRPVQAERLVTDHAPGTPREQVRGLDAIVRWHAGRYYTHLPPEEVESVVGEFCARAHLLLDATATIAEANRVASRLLYAASRRAGWHKMTVRERKRLGIHDHGQWIQEKDYARAQAGLGHPTGTSEWSLRAARGDR